MRSAKRRKAVLDGLLAPVLSEPQGSGGGGTGWYAHVITLEIAVFLLYAGTAAGLFALLVPGYLAWLRWGRRPSMAPGAPAPLVPPRVDVLVPVHDEAALIGAKLANLAALTYPPDRLRILIVDGASTDGTAELVEPLCATDARFALLCLDVADKTRQMNAGLARSRGEWVVVTDADARLAPDTLERLVATGEADPAVAVVGTAVVPERAHVLERLHWRVANAIRRHESERGWASLVAGPCYAFRRALFEQLPGRRRVGRRLRGARGRRRGPAGGDGRRHGHGAALAGPSA